MSNFELAVLAAVACVLSVAAIRRSVGAVPGFLMSAIFLVFGTFGGQLWEWSKFADGAGVPSVIVAIPFASSAAATAALWASMGAALGACYCGFNAQPVSSRRRAAVDNVDGFAFPMLVVSSLFIVLSVLGQGTSLWRRDVYLQSNGIEFLNKATGLPSMPVALLVTALAVLCSDRRLRVHCAIQSVIWFVLMAATGTRIAVSIPLTVAICLILRARDRSRAWRALVGLLCVLLTGLAVATFSVSLIARKVQHGVVNFFVLYEEVLQGGNSPVDELGSSLQQLIASIFAGFPVTEFSVVRQVPIGILLNNANPFPGSGLDAVFERYDPYGWVPLSFLGEWYGAVGPVGQVLLFALLAWSCGSMTSNLANSRFVLLAVVGPFFSILLSVLAFEYSSRIVWRICSIVVAGSIVALLVRDRAQTVRVFGSDSVPPETVDSVSSVVLAGKGS